MRLSRILVWLSCSLVPAAVSAAEPDSGTAPAHQVEAFHDSLLSAMRSDLDFAARSDRLSSEVASLFDLPAIARISVGRTWRSLDAAAQTEFVDVLQELVVATYAGRFHTYTGQAFDTLGVEEVPRGSVVKTELVRANGERVTLDYYFRGGKVFNVVADGVSDLSLRRADYSSIIKSEGYDALLNHLRANIAEQAPEKGAATSHASHQSIDPV